MEVPLGTPRLDDRENPETHERQGARWRSDDFVSTRRSWSSFPSIVMLLEDIEASDNAAPCAALEYHRMEYAHDC
jgi:hypothetical protein